MSSRRSVLGTLGSLCGTLGLSGCAQVLGRRTTPSTDLPPNPHAEDLPDRQHAWDDALRTDSHGNPLPPRHNRVLLLDLTETPDEEAMQTVERAMRTLEAAYEWDPDGLFHMLAWGSKYFERDGRLDAAPVRQPRVISRTDEPELLAFDAAVVLASDVSSHLAAAESALRGTRETLNGTAVDAHLGDVFTVRARRTGFIGEGLPAAHTDAEGVPTDAVSEAAPLFTGFFSGRRGTQASEDRVTIADGPYAGGTTMHLSHLRESLSEWWGMTDSERVERMFSTDFDPEDVADFGSTVPFEGDVAERVADQGVAGHHEKVARAREDGEPIVLRRDFNTVDGGQAGVHFLSLQASLDDFEKTRRAMNGWYLRDDHEDVTDRTNNGLLNFITVTSRANFYVPPRSARAFP